jgi:hypothetical protein
MTQAFERMTSQELEAYGWVWSCSRHKDPSREAAVQALIKSGLLGGSRA